MIIKIGDYNFEVDIDIERQANLFEDISSTNGDFSYSFDLPDITDVRDALGIKSLNTAPSYTLKKDAVIYSDSGEDIYTGFVRVDGVTDVVSCSFFSGNNSWFDACDINVRDYNYSMFDKDFTYANVTASFSLKNGIVWPLVDRGCFNERTTPTLYDNDWQPFVYVKDVVRSFLAQSGGIKIEGDLMNDPLFNTLVTSNNGLSGVQDKLDTITVYAGKSSGQTISSTSYTDITFDDTTSQSFVEGSDNNWDGTQYTVTKDIITAEIDLNLSFDISGATVVFVRVLVDGSAVYTNNPTFNGSDFTLNKTITLTDIYAGSVIKVQAKKGATNYVIKTNSSVKITPKKLRKVYVSQLLPDQNASDFLSSYLARFCCLASYDAKTKTIHTKMMDNIKNETEIDITPYLDSLEKDYTSIIDDYAKSTRFVYQESGIDVISEYNSVNTIPYGGGEIVIDNDFIEDRNDFLELEDVAPYQISIPSLGFRLPYLGYCSFEAVDSQRFVVVISSSGYAKFELSGTSIFAVGDLFRVVDSTNTTYNGVFRVSALTTTLGVDYITADSLGYDTDASGTVELIGIAEEVNEDQVTIANLPSTPIANFTDTTSLDWWRTSANSLSTFGLGYFWLPNVGKTINTVGKALYFDTVNDPQAYQLSLLDGYFRTATRILNDPIVLTATVYLPEKVFREIDFLRPVRLVTEEFNSLFLVNRITGYKGRSKPCEVELIKLS